MRVVVPGAAVGAPDAAGAVLGRRRDRRQQGSEHLHALEEDLDVAPLGPGAVTSASSGFAISLIDSELLLGQADDRVDVVAGLDDGADAADLVDSNGDRSLSDRDLDVDDRAGEPAAQGRGGDLRAGRDRLAGDLPDDLGDVGEGAGR